MTADARNGWAFETGSEFFHMSEMEHSGERVRAGAPRVRTMTDCECVCVIIFLCFMVYVRENAG